MKELVKERRIPEGRCPRVRLVHASQAKRTRAEPVSAMYERDVVRHCKMASRDLRGGLDMRSMVEMEDQMVTFTGSAGERSPDRLDSLTWGATPFLNTSFGPAGHGGIRKWAGSQELTDVAGTAVPTGGCSGGRRHRRTRRGISTAFRLLMTSRRGKADGGGTSGRGADYRTMRLPVVECCTWKQQI